MAAHSDARALASPPSSPPSFAALCRSLLIDSFAIPDYLLAAPIAGDWAAFNEGDNRGEVLGATF
jgi:acyl-CoA oxidase